MASSLQILVAEDNEDDAFILTHALKSAGLPGPVFICRDGQEVIDYLNGNGAFADRAQYPLPGLLILDIKMPHLTGLEVLRWVRAHPHCAVIPTIILTSSAHPKDVAEAFASGVNAYFLKPRTPEVMGDLLQLIHNFWTASVRPPVPGSKLIGEI
jgi:two-component system response regulator